MGAQYTDFLERSLDKAENSLREAKTELKEFMESSVYWETRAKELEAELTILQEIVSKSSKVCGKNNCNCRGAKPIRAAIDEYEKTYCKKEILKEDGSR